MQQNPLRFRKAEIQFAKLVRNKVQLAREKKDRIYKTVLMCLHKNWGDSQLKLYYRLEDINDTLCFVGKQNLRNAGDNTTSKCIVILPTPQ